MVTTFGLITGGNCDLGANIDRYRNDLQTTLDELDCKDIQIGRIATKKGQKGQKGHNVK